MGETPNPAGGAPANGNQDGSEGSFARRIKALTRQRDDADQRYNTLRTEYDALKTEAEREKNQRLATEAQLTEAIAKNKQAIIEGEVRARLGLRQARNVADAVKVFDFTGLDLEQDGKVKGLDERLETFVTERSYFFDPSPAAPAAGAALPAKPAPASPVGVVPPRVSGAGAAPPDVSKMSKEEYRQFARKERGLA